MSSIIPTLLLAGQAASTAGADTDRKLSTRAYIGLPALGHSQTWMHQE